MSGIRNIIFSAVCLVGCLVSAPAVAAEEMFDQVRINYTRKRPEKLDKKGQQELSQTWSKGCKQLGKALSGKESPWVYGVFQNFRCVLNGKAASKADNRGHFRVDILDTKSGVKFTIQQGRTKRQAVVLGSFSLSATEYFLQYLSDPEFVDILALSISEYLPAAGVLRGVEAGTAELKVNQIRLSDVGKVKYQHPGLPKRLTFYRLKFDKRERLWRSDVLGESELNADKDPVYALPDQVAEAAKSGAVYIHRSEGPYDADVRYRASFKDATKKIEEAIENDGLEAFLTGKVQNLLDALLGSAAAGYVGLRYGPQVLPSNGELGKLIAKTALLSLLVEVRAGPVKGLRYYYDTVPEQKASVTMADGSENNQYLGFSRHVLGFSFGLELGTFIDRITIDPKLGMWRFDARLPAAADENGAITAIENFNLGRTASLALEAGIEADADWYILRAWGGMDSGYSFLKTGGVVSSTRFGIDAFLSLGPEIPFFFDTTLKTTWILFYVFDRISIKLREDPELEVGENAITGIAYDAAYAGAGVAVSW